MDSTDNYSQKLAFSVLNKFIITWGGMIPESAEIGKKIAKKVLLNTPHGFLAPRPALTGFEAYMYDEIVPIAFDVPTKAGFSLTDGQSIVMLGEIAVLHKTFFLSQGNKYLDYLSSVYLPKLGCRADLAEALVIGIRDLDSKDLRKVLQRFFLGM